MKKVTPKEILQQSIEVKQALLQNEQTLDRISQAVETCIESLSKGGQILLCGNGGSAADAQHIAAELTGRFYLDRQPLRAEALHVNGSYLTAVANDYGFEAIYKRQVEAKANVGDILIVLSTSGNSPNILAALEQAKSQGARTIGLTGSTGGKMATMCDLLLTVPSTDTPRIQECHITMGHIICQLIETGLFGS